MTTFRNKIRGMFLGVAIGDALGMPVEGYTPERMAATHANVEYSIEDGILIREYLKPIGHKWFSAREPGTWTDDTQLTLAVADGIINAKTLNPDDIMESIAKAHVASYKTLGDQGFGGTTRLAIQSLEKGVQWRESAPRQFGTGFGNGVVMKVSPLAAFSCFNHNSERTSEFLATYLTLMTHPQRVAVSGTHAMLKALRYCLLEDDGPEGLFDRAEFAAEAVNGSLAGWRTMLLPKQDDSIGEHNIVARLATLVNWRAYTTRSISQEFGRGSVHVNDSLPFALMHFVRDPESIETLYRTVGAGGDTDSTGSMVGALLGAYHGENFWPKHLVEGLDRHDLILETADKLVDVCEEITKPVPREIGSV